MPINTEVRQLAVNLAFVSYDKARARRAVPQVLDGILVALCQRALCSNSASHAAGFVALFNVPHHHRYCDGLSHCPSTRLLALHWLNCRKKYRSDRTRLREGELFPKQGFLGAGDLFHRVNHWPFLGPFSCHYDRSIRIV